MTCDSILRWNPREQRLDGAENMSDSKDPAIKLFGTTIPVVASSPTRIADAEDADVEASDTEPVMSAAEGQKDASEGVTNVEVDSVLVTEADEEDEGAAISSSSGLTSSHKDEVNRTSIADEQAAARGKSETDCSTPEKVLKKPEKILPCPRCNSMDTKFCYYNNYNVNQPRHFCKNCQRYWTAGGTMRNVPVGAGRRKSKHSVASQCRSLVIPSSTGLRSAQPDTPNSTHHHQRALPCVPTSPAPPLIGNGTVLRFGQEVPLCESVASVLGIRGEQGETADSGSTIRGDDREEPCCASSDTERSGVQVYCNGLAPWAYPWRPTWNDGAAVEVHSGRPENGDSVSVPWGAGAVMAATLPFPLMAAPFWGFTAWPNGTWNASSTSNRGCPGNVSPTLGKHSRDGGDLEREEATTERCLWVPKTLRIDDPEEAAKSSIWAALGIKPDMGGGIIFQSKAEKRGNESDAARILHANPAALSRFESFQEST